MTAPRTALRHLALLLAVALVASGCGMIGGSGTYEVTASFPTTFNLFPGSPVKVLGLQVGQIKDIEVEEGNQSVTVTMLVDDETLVPRDVEAIVIPDSLLGERYIQLDPPYTGGERMPDGGEIPLEATTVPFEFDEVLEGLNRFVGGLDEDEVARLVSNAAEVLDGQGVELGETIDAADAAIDVLRENDEELIALASRLSDLNETLNTRDEEIGELIEDFSSLARILADDRVEIDRALNGLVRLTDELGRLLEVNRVDLEDDIATLARVGRTAQRNLDQVSLFVLSSAELFRHAERVVDRENNFIPLLNHTSQLEAAILDGLTNRLEGLCLGAGLPAEQCEGTFDEILSQVCLPVLPCPEDGSNGMPMAEALQEVVREAPPEVGEALVEQNEQNETGLGDLLQETLDEVLDTTGDLLGEPGDDESEDDGGLLEGGLGGGSGR